MQAERARIRRLRRLAQVRALACQQAAAEAARAEGHFAQTQKLAGRTQAMLDEYRARTRQANGLDLWQSVQFASGLSGIAATTQSDAEQARLAADQAQQALSQAERRRVAVADRLQLEEGALARKRTAPVLTARRIGTGLE